jgi:hypothetical protein
VVRAAPAAIAVASVAGLAALLEPEAYPSYDYAFAMASAQDVLAGRGTGYEVAVYSPVPHPLTLLEALAVVPLGDFAFPAFTVLALLAFGLLCWSLFRIGVTLASWPVGLLAGVLVFTSPPIFELATRTYGDIAFAALIATAIAMELRRPQRGRPVLAVLVLAGLVRPEAWLLSAGYWLYLAPRRPWRERIALGGLAALAPVAWMAMDTMLTGDPLHSVEVTRVYTEKAQASVSWDTLWEALRAVAGWPVMAGAVVGAVVAWRRDSRAAAVPLLVGTATLLATVAPALLGESPVLRRYLVVPAAVATLFFAIACLGWTAVRSRSPLWRPAGIGLMSVALVVLAVDRAELWDSHRQRQEGRVELLEHLHRWATAPRPHAYLAEPRCWPVRTPGYGYRPYLRLWVDVPPRAIAFHFDDATPERGLVLLPTARADYQRLMLTDVGRLTRQRVLRASRFAASFRRVAHSDHWELYASGVCRRRVERRLTRHGATTRAAGSSRGWIATGAPSSGQATR